MTHDTPVVFLHAYPLDGSMWASQVDSLADRRTLAPDFPGFGGRPPGEATMEGFAAAVLADMDAAGIDRAVLVGLSMGGYVAFRLHAARPDRVAALVLADTRSGADDDAARKRRTEQAERVRREGREGVGWLADAMVPALLGPSTRDDRPEVVADVRRRVDNADPEGVARALLALRDRPDSTASLASIEVPVLAIAGAEDEITPVAEARSISEGVAHGRLVVIPGAGHLSNLEDPAAFNEALRSFLA
jgi:3-oxoadipate enol-lactonase